MSNAPERPERPDLPYRILGARLLRLRAAQRLETSALAKSMGCSTAGVLHVERGAVLPTQERLCRWAELLGAAEELPTLLQLLQQDIDQAVQAGRRLARRPKVSRVRSAS